MNSIFNNDYLISSGLTTRGFSKTCAGAVKTLAKYEKNSYTLIMGSFVMSF